MFRFLLYFIPDVLDFPSGWAASTRVYGLHTFSKNADEIEPIEELVLDSDAAGLEANVESLEFEPSGLQLGADAGTFEHEASGSQLGGSCWISTLDLLFDSSRKLFPTERLPASLWVRFVSVVLKSQECSAEAILRSKDLIESHRIPQSKGYIMWFALNLTAKVCVYYAY